MNRKIVYIIIVSALLGLVGGWVIGSKNLLYKSNAEIKDSVIQRSDSSVLNWAPDFTLVEIKSPLDGEIQKAYFYKSKSSEPKPLVVNLHSWSWDYKQFDTLAVLSKQKDIHYIHPDFRGHNWTSKACCSEYVISDIDAAIDYAISHCNVDTSRIYVIGRSGGGYATLSSFMRLTHHVKKFSAWVPLADLVTWYEETKIRKMYYADNILVCTHSVGGKLNTEVAMQKSPIFWNTPVNKLNNTKLAIYTGVYDGLEGNGPIPITQSINFYNKILKDLKVSDSSQYVSDFEKLRLLETRKPTGDYGKIGNRDICLMKEYKNVKLVIFTGGHEMLSEFAFNDLFE